MFDSWQLDVHFDGSQDCTKILFVFVLEFEFLWGFSLHLLVGSPDRIDCIRWPAETKEGDRDISSLDLKSGQH